MVAGSKSGNVISKEWSDSNQITASHSACAKLLDGEQLQDKCEKKSINY